MSTAMTDFAAIWDYAAQPTEMLRECPLCETRVLDMVQVRDRYGYLVWLCWCRKAGDPTFDREIQSTGCGLKFLNPRMTADAYAAFYLGPYRAIVAERERANGREPMSDEKLRRMQGHYALDLAEWLWNYVVGQRDTLLDIGGSTGIVARMLGAVFNVKPTVLDPAAHELPDDIEALPMLIEDFDPSGRKWDLVTMCQTVDHLLDIPGTLRKVRGLLADGGRFFVDILDHDKVKELKIDHPFYLTPSVMERFLRQAGFGIVAIQRAADPRHVRFLCR